MIMKWEITGKNKDEIENVLKQIVDEGNKEIEKSKNEFTKKFGENPILSSSLSLTHLSYEKKKDKFILIFTMPFKKIPFYIKMFFNPDKKLKEVFKKMNINAKIKQI